MALPRSLSRRSLVALLLGTAPALAQSPPATGGDRPENVILMIADGFGPASLTLAAGCADRPLILTSLLLGTQTTRAADSVVTDSAAAGTAMASGVKTNLGAVGVDAEGRPVRTLLEAAEERGMATGIIVTSRLTHATPATFSSHVPSRDMETEIAAQQLTQGIEVLMGGGKQRYGPHLAAAEGAGYHIVTDRAGFDAIDGTPVLGLFTDSDMTFEIDRDPALEPSLSEMTAKAIELLDPLPGGFFLVIEGSRIDHAGHVNDVAAHMRDILAYDAAVRVATDFARKSGATLVVSTSDHETGGMSLGRSVGELPYYDWRAEGIRAVQSSGALLAEKLLAADDLDLTVRELTGIGELSKKDRRRLEKPIAAGDAADVQREILKLISRRARIGWTTTGHTGVDVYVFGTGPGSERFRGRHDNTELALTLAALMELQLGLSEAD